jgi:hypothetical protein
LAASLSYITDFITDHYSAHPNRTSNIILNALVRGNADGLMSIRGGPFYSGDPFATTAQTPLNHGPGTFGTLTASRAESSHPLLRRPSRVLATTQGASYRPTDHESMNIVITNDGGEMAFDQGPQIYIENAMNALGAMRSRVSNLFRNINLFLQTHHHGHAYRHSHRHGLRRQNALRSRPFFVGGTETEHPRFISYNRPTVISHNFESQLNNLANFTNFTEEQGLMHALQVKFNSLYKSTMLQDPHEDAFTRRTVELFVPFLLDRLTDNTRLLQAHSVQYTNMVISSYLTDVCQRQVIFWNSF